MPHQSRIPVCYTIASMTTDRAGTERHLLRLIRGLDRERFDPLLVVLQKSKWTDSFDDPLVPTRVLGFRSFWRPWDWRHVRGLARIYQEHGARVVELHYPDAHVMGAAAARLARVPVTIACRRDAADYYGRKERVYCRLGGLLTDRYLANSRQVVDAVSVVESLDPGRFDVVYNGLDLEAFDEQATHAIEPSHEAELSRGPVIAIAANLRPVKNISLFLEAARIILLDRPQARFLIMGSGEEEARLKQQADSLGVSRSIVWAGPVPQTAPYLKRATVGCLTSNSEGFSNAIIEYMAAGLPVAATRVGGAAEAVVEGVTGFLTARGDSEELAERLTWLLQNPDASRRLGQAGRDRVEQRFTLCRMVHAYQELYERLADARPSHQPQRAVSARALHRPSPQPPT